jgi:broad specificity phosphatase PhoE
MTEFLLVRHGETDWNVAQRFQGHADTPLNDNGRAQAGALAEELAAEDVDAVYSSDLARARETAEIIGARLGIPVVERGELREIDVGEWQGLSHGDVDERYPGALDRWRAGENGWRGGETYEQLAERVLQVLREIAGRHPGGRIVIVGHGGTIRSLRAHAAGVSIRESRNRSGPIGNCEVYRIRAEGGGFRGID